MPILSSTRRQVGTTPSRVLAALCIAIGSLVLAGWLFDITMFTRIFPAWASMKSETAISLILCGISLAFFEVEPRRFGASVLRRGLSRGFAAAAVLLNAVVLTEYLFGWSLGIDQLALIDPQAGTSFVPPGKDAPRGGVQLRVVGMRAVPVECTQKTRAGNRSSPGVGDRRSLFLLSFGISLRAAVAVPHRAFHLPGAPHFPWPCPAERGSPAGPQG